MRYLPVGIIFFVIVGLLFNASSSVRNMFSSGISAAADLAEQGYQIEGLIEGASYQSVIRIENDIPCVYVAVAKSQEMMQLGCVVEKTTHVEDN